MPYYLTTISVSCNAKNDEDFQKKLEKFLIGARETKECTPYVNEISKRNHENKVEKLSDIVIKSLNVQK